MLDGYYKEIGHSLNIARKENTQQMLKIEELIKEKLQLVNEFNTSINSKRTLKIDNLFSLDISDTNKTNNKSILENDIDAKVFGILRKCKYPHNI